MNILNSRLNITIIVPLINTQKARISVLRSGDGDGGGGWRGFFEGKRRTILGSDF